MIYCTHCGSEYEDGVTSCADCGGVELVGAEEMKRRGLKLPQDLDTRKFVRAATAEDPLTSERYVAVLEAAQIPVFARPRRAGPVDGLTTAAAPWWELLVPEEHLERASQLLEEEREVEESTTAENIRAAEEEAGS